MKYKFIFIYLLFLVANAQAGHKKIITTAKDTIQHITLDTLEVSAPAGLPPYQPSAPRTWEINNTRISLGFDWIAKTADVKEWISLQPYFYATDTLELDAKSVLIDSVILLGKKTNTPLIYGYTDNKLKIHFGHIIQAKDSIRLYLKYKAMPYAEQTGGSAAITDDRGLYFINTDYSIPHKPAEIWTQGETESNSHWMITIDKPNTRFTTQVELTVPDSFTTLSNGAIIKQQKGAKGMRTDIWKMDMPIQAYAVMFAVGKFSIIKEKWRAKEVNYYVEREYAPYAKAMFNHTPAMIDYFSQRTGVPYPWNKYSQVVVRDYVSGAMENTSASLFGEFMNQDAREIADKNSEDVVSHELFHQWFGDYVTAESWSNITVNESFANYGERLWRAHEYGKASGDELAWNDLQRYISASFLKDPQLVRFYYDNREVVFDAVSYNKGGAILHYINTLIGDAAFDQAMKIYLTRNALHSGEAHNWRLAVEEATGLDWNWFFNEWYFHAGHPVLKVNYKYQDSASQLLVTVSQAQEDSAYMYQLPLKTAIIYGNDKTVVDWNITKRKQTFIYNYKNGFKPVIIPDCEHVLPGTLRENKKPEQWLIEYKQSNDYVSKLLAVKDAFKEISDSISQEIITLALDDTLKSITRNALESLNDVRSEKYRKKWTNAIVHLAVNDSNKQVRAAAFDIIGTWKLAAFRQEAIHAINDSSYLVAGSALAALYELDGDTAYIVARKMLSVNPRSVLKYAVWTIIGKKGADEDISLFEQEAPFEQGTKKFSFSTDLESYLKKVKSDNSFSRGVDTYISLITSEEMKSYRVALAGRLFQLGDDEKSNTKSNDENEQVAIAKKRMGIIKIALQKVINAEKDNSAADEFKKMMKEIFEGE